MSVTYRRARVVARWLGAGALTSIGSCVLMIAAWGAGIALAPGEDPGVYGWVLAGVTGAVWIALVIAAALAVPNRWAKLAPLLVSAAWLGVVVIAASNLTASSLPLMPAPVAFVVITGFTIPVAVVLATGAFAALLVAATREGSHSPQAINEADREVSTLHEPSPAPLATTQIRDQTGTEETRAETPDQDPPVARISERKSEGDAD